MSDRRKHPLFRAILSKLPAKLRFKLMRDQLKIPTELDDNFTFRVAKTQDELSAAYRILHDAYVDSGYSKPQASGMRIVKYFALPSTTTLIALYQGEVVGTISIVRRGSFGLPMEKAFNLADSIDSNKVVAEISALAIDSKFRQKRGALFLPLLKFFWEYITGYMKLDAIAITVNPSMSDFYEGFLGFKRLKNAEVSDYDFANGNPGVGLWFDVIRAESNMFKMYGHQPPIKDLYAYFFTLKLPHFDFPKRDFYKSSDPVMTPEMLKHFFVDKSNVFEELTLKERIGLTAIYPEKHYNGYLPKLDREYNRNSTRYAVNIPCIMPIHDNQEFSIIDVGRYGLCVVSPIKLEGIVMFKIPVSKDYVAEVRGEVRWQNNNAYGIRLIQTDAAWLTFCNYLQQDFEKLVSPEIELKVANK